MACQCRAGEISTRNRTESLRKPFATTVPTPPNHKYFPPASESPPERGNRATLLRRIKPGRKELCVMIKKTLIASAVLLGSGLLLFGTDAFSYLTTTTRRVKSEIKANVPLEFEIDRARTMVAELIPDIQKNMHVIAQEEVDVEELRDQISRAEKNLATERQRILVLRADLDNSSGKFHYAGGHVASGEQVRIELSRRFERFQTAEATMNAKRQMLEAREQSLGAARDKLEGMLASKRDLEVQVQNLEARLKMLQAVQTTSQFQFDDSQLSRCKKVVQELRKRLDVAERILEQDGKLVENLTVDTESVEDIGEQVDRYFGHTTEPVPSDRAAL
jgi:hypothetical protein